MRIKLSLNNRSKIQHPLPLKKEQLDADGLIQSNRSIEWYKVELITKSYTQYKIDY